MLPVAVRGDALCYLCVGHFFKAQVYARRPLNLKTGRWPPSFKEVPQVQGQRANKVIEDSGRPLVDCRQEANGRLDDEYREYRKDSESF